MSMHTGWNMEPAEKIQSYKRWSRASTCEYSISTCSTPACKFSARSDLPFRQRSSRGSLMLAGTYGAKKIIWRNGQSSQMSKSRCKNLAWDLNISEGVGDPDADQCQSWPRSGMIKMAIYGNQIWRRAHAHHLHIPRHRCQQTQTWNDFSFRQKNNIAFWSILPSDCSAEMAKAGTLTTLLRTQ